MRRFVITLAIIQIFLVSPVFADSYVGHPLPDWQEGEMMIHHISTGSGNSAFTIMPDGTTMLFDAGDVDRIAMKKYAPLKLFEPLPDSSRRAGQWIADYIRQFAPKPFGPKLDYAVISHFHSDHFGKLQANSPQSRTKAYRLTGIMDVAEEIPIGTLIDRAAPDYRIPTDLRACEPAGTLANYIAFADYRRKHNMAVEGIRVGRNDQIKLAHDAGRFSTFSVRNLAANGTLWTGRGEETFQLIPWDQAGGCKVEENPFSLAVKISYGRFNYYTGGDLTGMAEEGKPSWFDVETPLGAAIGAVDVMSLDHHGNRDATNASFLGTLHPRVIVQQNWVSDQPGGEVLHRMVSPTLIPGPRDIFSVGMALETRVALGVWMERAYGSFSGHIVVRVAPGGASYEVFILDETTRTRLVKAHFGPYASH